MVKRSYEKHTKSCCCTFANVNGKWFMFSETTKTLENDVQIFKNKISFVFIDEHPLCTNLVILFKRSIIEHISWLCPCKVLFGFNIQKIEICIGIDMNIQRAIQNGKNKRAYNFRLKSKSAHIMKNPYQHTIQAENSSFFVLFMYDVILLWFLCRATTRPFFLYHKHTNARAAVFAHLTIYALAHMWCVSMCVNRCMLLKGETIPQYMYTKRTNDNKKKSSLVYCILK